jgi:hypothetical protein
VVSERLISVDELASQGRFFEEAPFGGTAPSTMVQRPSKEEYQQNFVPMQPGTLDRDSWIGTLVDLFSPDDKNPASRRFIDLDLATGQLQVSADTGGEKWGRRFDKSTTVNPIITPTGTWVTCKTSFFSKVPRDAPIYQDAQAGALNFTLVIGYAFGKKVIKWNGLYDGRGGMFDGKQVPASDCDNFWEFV